jgi:hypothetical protein
LQEVEQHTMRLKERFGAFSHAPPRTAFDPDQQEKQLNMLLPNVSNLCTAYINIFIKSYQLNI